MYSKKTMTNTSFIHSNTGLGTLFVLASLWSNTLIANSPSAWQVTPTTCISENVSGNCTMTLAIAIKQTLSGQHCLFLEGEMLTCFPAVPKTFEHQLSLSQSAVLNLLDGAGATVAEQQLVVQYLKRKRRRTRAPWSLF